MITIASNPILTRFSLWTRAATSGRGRPSGHISSMAQAFLCSPRLRTRPGAPQPREMEETLRHAAQLSAESCAQEQVQAFSTLKARLAEGSFGPPLPPIERDYSLDDVREMEDEEAAALGEAPSWEMVCAVATKLARKRERTRSPRGRVSQGDSLGAPFVGSASASFSIGRSLESVVTLRLCRRFPGRIVFGGPIDAGALGRGSANARVVADQAPGAVSTLLGSTAAPRGAQAVAMSELSAVAPGRMQEEEASVTSGVLRGHCLTPP